MRRFYSVCVLIFLFTISVVEAQEQILNITRESASDAILQAEKDMKEMSEAGFGVVYVKDTTIAAKEAFNETNYNLVLEKAAEVFNRKQRAYNISDSLRALELRIKEFNETGLNITEAEEISNTAMSAFKNETFDEAEELIFEAHEKLGEAKAEATLLKAMYRAARENIVSFVREHWFSILISFAILSVIMFISYKRIMKIIIRRRLDHLRIEKGVLVNLMKKAQTDHFLEGVLPRETYMIKMKKYKERVLEIDRTMPVLEARLRGEKLKIEEAKK